MQKNTSKKYCDNEDQLLRDHCNFMDKSRIKLSNSFDKYLLTFATGTLYLSINFSSDKDFLVNKNLLAFGWFSLIVSIASTLLSIYASIKAHEVEMDYDVEDIKNVQNGKPRTTRENIWSSITDICTIIGISTFLLGIVFLSITYFQNINVNKINNFYHHGRK